LSATTTLIFNAKWRKWRNVIKTMDEKYVKIKITYVKYVK